MKYYFVIAKCGHIGRNKYVEVTFAIKAESKKEAVQLVINRGKVKKQLKNSISNVYEVSYEEYMNQMNINKDNIYLHAHYKREVDVDELCIKTFDNRKRYKSYYEFESREEKIKYIFKKREYLERVC